MSNTVVNRITVYPLSIPMRHRASHSAATRDASTTLLCAVELRDGTIGWGETIPREYVTGETKDSVLRDLEAELIPRLIDLRPQSFPDALQRIDELPLEHPAGRPMTAARAALELALLDAYMRYFNRSVDDIAGWLDLPRVGSPGSAGRVRFAGVIASNDPEKAAKLLRKYRWGGFKCLKLKLGFENDDEIVSRVLPPLRKRLDRGRMRMRIDLNGALDIHRFRFKLKRAEFDFIEAFEQPVPRGSEFDLAAIQEMLGERWIVHDESLILAEDGERLVDVPVKTGFNVRVSKCGGLMPSMRLAAQAIRDGASLQVGCMVGETSVLAAAGLALIGTCPGITWAEGCFGTRLLADDVVERSLRFGFGGRLPRLRGPGWGVEVDPQGVRALQSEDATVFVL